MPTTAWAISPRPGTARQARDRRQVVLAQREARRLVTERWGRLPMPVVAPGRSACRAPARCRGSLGRRGDHRQAPPRVARRRHRRTVSACLAGATAITDSVGADGIVRRPDLALAGNGTVAMLTSLTVVGAARGWLAAPVDRRRRRRAPAVSSQRAPCDGRRDRRHGWAGLSVPWRGRAVGRHVDGRASCRPWRTRRDRGDVAFGAATRRRAGAGSSALLASAPGRRRPSREGPTSKPRRTATKSASACGLRSATSRRRC